MENTDDRIELSEDLADLAKLAASQSYEDVRLFLARLIRKYRIRLPELAVKLDQSLKTTQTRSSGASIMRRTSAHDHTQNNAHPANLPVDSESKLSLIRVFDDTNGISAPLLAQDVSLQLNNLVKERKEQRLLEAHGIDASRSAILVGAPGLGKTLSARWIASELGKPLWVLDLSVVMSSLLGKTGSNIRSVLDYAKANNAILLLDEIDAIAKRRNDENDIGELKRLVTVILQEVDHWPTTSLLLAATNHPEIVDPALWRRFDTVINFGPPGPEQIEAALIRFLSSDVEKWRPWLPKLVSKFSKQSLADVEREVANLRRRSVLEQLDPIALIYGNDSSQIADIPHAMRVQIALELAHSGHYKQREINRLTGVSRDTIRKHAGSILKK